MNKKRDDNKVETGGAIERERERGSARSDPNTSILLSPSFLLNPHLVLVFTLFIPFFFKCL
jgi:hypothetical protein